MYVRCSQCDWSQDDFWDSYYSKLKSIGNWHDIVIKALRLPKDEQVIEAGLSYIAAHPEAKLKENNVGLVEVPVKDYVIYLLQYELNDLKKMKWLTHNDFLADPNPTCPKCESVDLSID